MLESFLFLLFVSATAYREKSQVSYCSVQIRNKQENLLVLCLIPGKLFQEVSGNRGAPDLFITILQVGEGRNLHMARAFYNSLKSDEFGPFLIFFICNYVSIKTSLTEYDHPGQTES